MTSPGNVIVGLSGGVDSAVAALLLLQQGWRVSGLFMKNWEEEDHQGFCAAAEDLRMAQAVADQLGFPLHRVNFATEYWDRVFDQFLAEYAAGRTPNPDVLCNREIKFRAFLDHALGLGADRIATGHYAELERNGETRLLRALDENKDQTYFLHQLSEEQLARSLFPLGGLRKGQVRELARQHGLPNHQRKDSTGICFIGERRFSAFLSRYLPARPGPIVNPEGEQLGEHQGLMHYTLGQRKGIGLGGVKDGQELPWFVVDKDLEHNRLVVAQGHDHPLLLSPALRAGPPHWINGAPTPREGGSAGLSRELSRSPAPLRCLARIRHRQPLQGCAVALDGDGCRVTFDRPQWAVAPGQSIAFYRDRRCLGGAVIEQREPS